MAAFNISIYNIRSVVELTSIEYLKAKLILKLYLVLIQRKLDMLPYAIRNMLLN